MKKIQLFAVFCLIVFLFSATAWASDRLDVSKDTPAILAALNRMDIIPLDDTAIAEIRGQAKYVMGKIFGLNTWDFSHNREVKWVYGIPGIAVGWRYGNWGGPFYTNNGPPVDKLDDLFRQHDLGDLTNTELGEELGSLPKTFSSAWGGPIYDKRSYGEPWGPDWRHWFYGVYVSKITYSDLSQGGRFRFFWQRMPLTEYARRQAFIAVPWFPGP